ncbi:hypothetical protein RN001_013833 [Aquatica leii]|uniref:DUF4817 domain-containing protein n=1 Tax=Aquatica leii TaxID=1421715 RepID=A0AAN7QDH5_9COLE|nr:hypothetical protein RN001_013833 [Aquatica leii]
MEAYPGNHRAFCIRAYYRNGDSIVSAQRLYRTEFNVRNAPKDDTIRKWIRMFENTGSSVKIQHPDLHFCRWLNQSVITKKNVSTYIPQRKS